MTERAGNEAAGQFNLYIADTRPPVKEEQAKSAVAALKFNFCGTPYAGFTTVPCIRMLTLFVACEIVGTYKPVSTNAMSTRAQIAFCASENAPVTAPGTVFIYQHSDGYPEGVLPVLEPFARSFAQHRSLQDTAYATARCVVALAHARAEERKGWQETGADWLDAAKPDYVGLGVDATLHADIAYFYHVSPTRIAVYAVSASGKAQPDFFLLVASVSLTPPALQSQSVPAA